MEIAEDLEIDKEKKILSEKKREREEESAHLLLFNFNKLSLRSLFLLHFLHGTVFHPLITSSVLSPSLSPFLFAYTSKAPLNSTLD